MLIKQLSAFDSFDRDLCADLCRIAVENIQVKLILGDKDIKGFYKRILEQADATEAYAQTVAELLGGTQ